MTCLYCGKKLGFFSRYKDTPFCSEEHLRSHQDEMERALMERLGSKISAQSGQKEMARDEAPELKGNHREDNRADSGAKHFDAPLEVERTPARVPVARPLAGALAPEVSSRATSQSATSRRGGSRNFPTAAMPDPVAELSPLPAADRPIDKRALLEGRDAPPAEKPLERRATKKQEGDAKEGQICEDFFEAEQKPVDGLRTDKPWFAPSSFAIIVQADFCAPTLPEVAMQLEPAFVEDEFEFDLAAQRHNAAETALNPEEPALREVEPEALPFEAATAELPKLSGFVPSGMPTVASLAGAPSDDIWDCFPAEETLLELEFQSSGAAPDPSKPLPPIGGRPEVPMRPRHRYPYAGSDLRTRWNELAEDFTVLAFTAADEWSGVQPGAYRNVLEEKVAEEKAQILPHLRVSLSLSALCAQTIRSEETESFERDPAGQRGVGLGPEAGLYRESAIGEWRARLQYPSGATRWEPRFRFPQSPPAKPMPAVNFPSLFQLTPSMPPRPEGNLHHA
jgi:hypothetical protein